MGFKAVAPLEAGQGTTDNEAWKGSLKSKDSLFWKDYVLDLEAYLTGEAFDDPDAAMFLSQMDFKVSVELPTEIKDHNGQVETTGKKATWTLVPGRKDHMTMNARQYKPGSIGGAAAGVLILTGAGLFFLRRERQSSPVDGAQVEQQQ